MSTASSADCRQPGGSGPGSVVDVTAPTGQGPSAATAPSTGTDGVHDGEPTVCDLVARARAGHQDAWNALVERYAPLVHAIAHRYGLHGADLDDVVQTLWLRLVEHLADIRDPQALPGWIATTTRNDCLKTLRLRRRTQPVDPLADREEDLAPPAAQDLTDPLDTAVVERLVTTSRHHALLAAFADLPDRHRELLQLLTADPAIPYAQISTRLGMPIGAIGPTRARALHRIRQHPAVAPWLHVDTDDHRHAAEHA